MSFAKNITLFTTCKPFFGEAAILQRNALLSWKKLGLSIIICGDETGAKEAADNIGATHVPAVERNDKGTPYISSVFAEAAKVAKTPFLAYVNADILLRPRVLTAMSSSVKDRDPTAPFLMTCRRRNIPIGHLLEEAEDDLWLTLDGLDEKSGSWDQSNAIDLFLFNRGLFGHIIPLVVGHMQWDNWLLWKAREVGAEILDASLDAALLHPIHGYSSDGTGLRQRSQGQVAANNRQLADGNITDLNTATTHLLVDGVCVKRTEKNHIILTRFCQPDYDTELWSGFRYLLDTGSNHSAAEIMDCCRTILWRQARFFPFLEDANLTHDAVYKIISDAQKYQASNNVLAAANLIQDMVCADFIERIRSVMDSGRDIYIRGCGEAGKRMLHLLQRHKINITAFLDRDKQNTGKFISGVPVENIGGPALRPHAFILIASMHMAEIMEIFEAQNMTKFQDYSG